MGLVNYLINFIKIFIRQMALDLLQHRVCYLYLNKKRKMKVENLWKNHGYLRFCRRSIDDGELTSPYEDGDNAYSYVICPHCVAKNIIDGYGEDDD